MCLLLHLLQVFTIHRAHVYCYRIMNVLFLLFFILALALSRSPPSLSFSRSLNSSLFRIEVEPNYGRII